MSWPAGDGLGCVVQRCPGAKGRKALKVALLSLEIASQCVRQGRLVAGATHSFQGHGILQLATLDRIPPVERCKP